MLPSVEAAVAHRLLLLPPPQPLQDISGCEDAATKAGVQLGAARKQLEKLEKEGAKGAAEKTKLEAQQAAAMEVRAACRIGWPGLG